MDTAMPPPPASGYSLFDHRAVGLATFFGTPLAGSILMGLNYRRLGKTAAAVGIIALGAGLTGLLLLIGYALPSGVGTIIPIGVMFGMMYGAKALQGASVEQHVRLGGKLASKWLAFGIGVAVLVPLMLAIFAVVFTSVPSTKVTIGSKDEVYYSGKATEQDAKALGQSLQSIGYLKDRGVSVLLSKGKGGFTVSFVVKEGAWNDAEQVSAFETIARRIAPTIGGLPVKVHLVDSSLDTKKEFTVE
jgi:hypothetical protein